jgi:hypothetical protein
MTLMHGLYKWIVVIYYQSFTAENIMFVYMLHLPKLNACLKYDLHFDIEELLLIKECYNKAGLECKQATWVPKNINLTIWYHGMP